MKTKTSPAQDRPRSRRVFFALWPESEVNNQLNAAFMASKYYETSRGRRYRKHNLHITLHFLGNLSEEQLNCAKQQASLVSGSMFTLNIDHFGRFKRAGVLWLAPSMVPAELTSFQQQLGEALRSCDYQPETREYRPHVTLMRKFHEKVEDNRIESIEWSVQQFALVESVPVEGGVEYQPLEFYDLREAG